MNSCIWKQSIWTTWKHCTWFQTHWTPWLMRLPIALANCPNYFAPLKSWTRKKIFFYLCGPWFTTKLCNLNTTRDWLERLDKGNPPASKPSQWLHPQEARSGPCFHLLWSSSVCRLTLLCFPPSDSSTTVCLWLPHCGHLKRKWQCHSSDVKERHSGDRVTHVFGPFWTAV